MKSSNCCTDRESEFDPQGKREKNDNQLPQAVIWHTHICCDMHIYKKQIQVCLKTETKSHNSNLLEYVEIVEIMRHI